MKTLSKAFPMRMFSLALMGIFAAACSVPTPLVPRETLFQSYERSAPSVSPDGTHLLWTEPYNGVRNLYIRTVGEQDARPLTTSDHPVGYFLWSRDSELAIYSQSGGGEPGYRVVNIATGETRPLLQKKDDGAPKNVIVEFVSLSVNKPNQIAVMLNDRDPSVFDLHILDLRTGTSHRIAEGRPNLLRWYVDGDLNLRGYLLSESDGGQSFWRYVNGRFQHEITWTLMDDSSWPILFPTDGKFCYMLDSRGRKSTALVKYDFATKQTTLLAGDPDNDIRKALYNRSTHEMDGAFVQKDKIVWLPISDFFRKHIEFLESRLKGEVEIYNRSIDQKVWVVVQDSDTAPPMYYLYFTDDQRLEPLFSASDKLKAIDNFVPMKAIQFEARDGMTIHGYLSTPKSGKGPWPTVLLIHGGPWRRDSWGFNPEVQWLANRGYAVLQINFRGSIGYNKIYQNAGNREWGKAMETDLADGVKWAIDNKIVRSGDVVVMGGSYGGYAALMGAIESPQLYKAAVVVNPFVDLADYLSIIPPHWEAYRTNLEQRVGIVPRYASGLKRAELKDTTDWNETDRSELQLLKDVSPFYRSDSLDLPILYGQGEKDPLARPAVAKEYVSMLKGQGVKVDFVTYEKSGHILNEADRLDFYLQAEVFLATYLGGRVEK